MSQADGQEYSSAMDCTCEEYRCPCHYELIELRKTFEVLRRTTEHLLKREEALLLEVKELQDFVMGIRSREIERHVSGQE